MGIYVRKYAKQLSIKKETKNDMIKKWAKIPEKRRENRKKYY